MRIAPHLSRALLTLTLAGASAAAQNPVVEPGTEQFALKARTNGVEYRIDVWLPPGLDTMTVRPSVLYLTDGNLEFHIAHQTYSMLAMAGEVSPMIVVGVSYPQADGRGITPSFMVNRTRDYTPTDISTMPGGGGSAAFLAFLKDELIPVVESRWRADPTRRGLGGHSLGGLFATYALLHEPGLFTRYWLGSPSLWWDKEVAFTWLAAAKKGATQPSGRAFLSVGAFESDQMVPPMQHMAAELARNFPALHVASHVYPGESHASVVGASMSRAIRFLYGDFGRPTIALTPAQRAEYAGEWAAGGLTIRLRPTPKGMAMAFTMMGIPVTDNLKAAARDTLFSNEMLATQWVAVRDAKGKLTSLRGTLMGQTQEYTRKKP